MVDYYNNKAERSDWNIVQDGKQKNTVKADYWPIVIAVLLWIICIGMSIARACQANASNSTKIFSLMEFVIIFNENTFSTFISLVVAFLYQFLSRKNTDRRKGAILSPDFIPYTIISTVAYSLVAVINACRYCLPTIIMMLIASCVYVILFFGFMVTIKGGNGE